jgi:threonine aldolase
MKQTTIHYNCNMQPVELRSDTFTQPTQPMLKAMFEAPVGDDVFGEDPTVNRLQTLAADMFGMEAGLFCPSGTMTNQIAINVHTRPGDEVICEQGAHVYFYEGGGIGRLSGCQARTIAGDRGRINAEQIRAVINPDDVHRPRTRLVCLENTCNRGGGSTYSLGQMHSIRALCDEQQLTLHLDGARVLNAIVANGEEPSEYSKIFHSISVCLSKGLGAPVGSVLLGSADFIKEAKRTRKVFGGGMRQAGYLAAASIYALENHVGRLQDDHNRAKQLAAILEKTAWVKSVMPVETNIVIFEVGEEQPASHWLDKLKQNGIFAAATSTTTIRMVTHLGFGDAGLERVTEVLQSL